MKIKSIKLKDKIKEVEFSPKELYMLKKKIKAENPQCKVSENDLNGIIHSSAKRAFRDALIVFFGMVFLQIPFIVSERLNRRLDFLFVSVAVVFFLYLVVYLSGKLRNMPVCAQFKLIRLAIKLIFTTGV
ncbi:hypothetical protein D0525_24435 [Salmonella enterica]|uniref:hypothetical protein n=1 Tax=Salmonella enterica TaxID=28901 RepID=UPI0010133A8E|nr:hypothetical protein [Salmonella enterica]RXO30040.1 hypothetical protein D0525_24435 [Salmonella enterica]